MAWAIMYNGAWDYTADTRGYTWVAISRDLFDTMHQALNVMLVCGSYDERK